MDVRIRPRSPQPMSVAERPVEIDLSPLFQPITIRNLTLLNRFVMPAMQRFWCADGHPFPELGEYYCRRLEGGAALIITEACAVDDPSATQVSHYCRISDPTSDAWRDCLRPVKEADGKFFMQLWHEGAARAEGGDGPYSQFPTLSPSGLLSADRANGRAATAAELARIRDAFVRGAVIARNLGAAGVEVHAAHGSLLHQFLWKRVNRRCDGYGGDDIRSRVRFPAEIVAAIRAALGSDFPISFRFSQWTTTDYTAKIVESPGELEIMLSVLRCAGVDLFHVSARRFWTPEWHGSDLSLAGWTKKLTDARVLAVGSVGFDIDVMETLGAGKEARFTGRASFAELLRRFSRGDFDMIAIGRGQIGDPHMVRKLSEGRLGDIRAFTVADLNVKDADISNAEVGVSG